MQRSEQICNAAKIGIGYLHACEDAAKKRVLQLFRKSNSIDYENITRKPE